MPVFRLIASKPSLLPLFMCVPVMYATATTMVGRNLTSSVSVSFFPSISWIVRSEGFHYFSPAEY